MEYKYVHLKTSVTVHRRRKFQSTETPTKKMSSARSLHSSLAQTSNSIKGEEPPRLILDSAKDAFATPKSLGAISPPYSSVKDLLIVYSPSPTKSTRSRLLDKLDMADEFVVQSHARRRYSKGKSIQPCASPRNANRRVRRKGEMLDKREDLIGAIIEEIERMHRRKRRARKGKIASTPSSDILLDGTTHGINLDSIGGAIHDLIMWKDVAKTSLWFGLGSLFFFSSCFTKEINCSLFSALSHLGILFLATSFLSNTLSHRNRAQIPSNFNLEEDDMLKAIKWIFPVANLAVSKIREMFSGEPAITLKVLPLLVAGAEYGHILTFGRVALAGFFIMFTLPALYSSYAISITRAGEWIKQRVRDAWGACSRKRIIAIAVLLAFWNISSVKTRVFAAFFSLVILRCLRTNVRLQDSANAVKEDLNVPNA